MARHETDLKSNHYWADLMQCSSLENLAEHKTIQCITELPLMYEACTVDDLHEVYDCLGLGEGEIFTAITVAGENESVAEKREEIEEDDFASSASNSSFKSIGEDVMAAAAAKLGVALGGGVNIAEALSKLKIDQEGK